MAPETPKGISSRLLTMKFMQRAAASNESTPGSESEGSSTKKRKLGQDAPLSHLSVEIDKASIQAALDEREAKRQAALERHTGNDTHWVLDSKWQNSTGANNKPRPLEVVYVGYGDVDSSDDNLDDPQQGRTTTKKKKSKEPKPSSSDISGTDEDEDEDEASDAGDTPNSKADEHYSKNSPSSKKLKRSSSNKSTEASNAKRFRDERKKKEVRLNKLTSISGGGDTAKSSQNRKSMTCYNCSQPGHRAQDCPLKGSQFKSRKV